MVYGSARTHLLHESIVLAAERIIVAQLIVGAVSFLIYAAVLGITDSPSLTAVMIVSFLLQTVNAALVAAVLLNWERTSFFITPGEIVVRRGVVEIKEEVYSYDDVGPIELSQGKLGKVLNYGSVYFYSQKKKEEVGITNIPRPHYYYDIVKDFKDNHEVKKLKQN